MGNANESKIVLHILSTLNSYYYWSSVNQYLSTRLWDNIPGSAQRTPQINYHGEIFIVISEFQPEWFKFYWFTRQTE